MEERAFQLLVISPEGNFPEEVRWLHKLFDAGLPTLHLRKPGWDFKQLWHFARQIDACYYSRIMVHYEERLLEEEAFRGVHYQPAALPAEKPSFTVSSGLHAWNEFRQLENRLDYAFLSPFFSSISKKGYGANKGLWDIPAGIKKEKVMALGGINAENLPEVQQAGFSGSAVLGAVWESGNPLQAYLKLIEKLKEYPYEWQKRDLM